MLSSFVLALGTCLAGCGGAREGGTGGARFIQKASGSSGALSAVRMAAQRTLASAAGVEFQLDGSTALGSSPAPVLGSGEFDFPSSTGSETIDLGEVRHQEPGTEHVVFLPSRVYLQPKALATSVLPKGKEWVSATLAGSDSANTNFPLFALQVEGVNPQLSLNEIEDGAIFAVRLGRAQISGEQTQAYQVIVDLPRALSASHGPAGAVFGQAIQSELAAAGSAGASTRPSTSMQVWIDSTGHVLRLRTAPPGAGVGTATMTMCCFGVPVEVSSPPRARVVDIGSLTPSGERENNGGGDSDGG